MSNTFKVGDVTTTREGKPARIICVDRMSKDYPVVALIMDGGGEGLTAHSADGLYLGGVGGSARDLILPKRLEDLAVDTPILVRDREDEKWEKRHFAKAVAGRATCWNNGATSWSAEPYDTGAWNFWKLP